MRKKWKEKIAEIKRVAYGGIDKLESRVSELEKANCKHPEDKVELIHPFSFNQDHYGSDFCLKCGTIIKRYETEEEYLHELCKKKQAEVDLVDKRLIEIRDSKAASKTRKS